MAANASALLVATCGSRQPVAADVVVEAGPNALLFFRRGYADPAPQARPAPRFAATRGVSCGMVRDAQFATSGARRDLWSPVADDDRRGVPRFIESRARGAQTCNFPKQGSARQSTRTPFARISRPSAFRCEPEGEQRRQRRPFRAKQVEAPAMAHARARAKAGVFMVGFGGERKPRDVASRPLAACACSWKQQRMDGGAKVKLRPRRCGADPADCPLGLMPDMGSAGRRIRSVRPGSA